MTTVHEQDVVTEREIPATRLSAIAWLVLALVVAATAAWEWRMRDLGLVAGDLDDSKSSWAVERRKVDSGEHDGVVIIGGSRILFDTNLDVWQEMTGRRPLQLALAGVERRSHSSTTSRTTPVSPGSCVIDLTPRQFFREGAANPESSRACWTTGPTKGPPGARATASDSSCRATSRSSMTNTRSRRSSIELDAAEPGRNVGGPYLRPWKLSETYEDRQYGAVAQDRDGLAPARTRDRSLVVGGRGRRRRRR